MDELVVGGKRYISSKRASEITAYAKDYIGQLARGGKVPGTRFGRAWFVDEAALLAYLGKEPEVQSVAPDAISEKAQTAPKSNRQKPLLTHHMIAPATFPKTWADIKYLEDHAELFPTLIPNVHEDVVEKISSHQQPAQVITPRTDLVSVESRVAALVDGIRPKSAVLRAPAKKVIIQERTITKPPLVPQVKAKPLPSRSIKVEVKWSRGPFAAALATLVLVFGSVVSFSIFKGMPIQGGEHLTASASYGFEEFITLMREARILESGVQALSGFYYLLKDSFSVFVQTALQFIGNLL
jgi:hypothetical protein